MANKYLKILYYIGFVLIFFNTFVLYFIYKTNFNILVGALVWIGLPIFILIFNQKYLINYYKKVLKYPIIKYYLWFQGIMLLTTIAHIFLRKYSAPFTYYIIRFYSFYIITTILYLYVPLVIDLKINKKNIIKIFYSMLYVVFCIAIIEFFVNRFDINFIKIILDFFTNQRLCLYNYLFAGLDDINRSHSLFREPSTLGQFIAITMPFVLNSIHSDIKIFINKYINYFFKKTFLIVMFLALFFTESPIYIVICLIEFIILVLFIYRQIIRKYLLYIIFAGIFATILLTVLVRISIESPNSIIQRIHTVIYCLGDYNNLVLLEPSLATRITSYATQLVVFSKNIFWGIGLFNISAYLANKFVVLAPLPMTLELLNNYYEQANVVGVNPSLIYTTLAETGLFGLTFFIMFLVKNFQILVFLLKRVNKTYYVFLYSLFQSLIMIIILSFYNLSLNSSFLWLTLGLILMFLHSYKNHELNN